MVEKDLLNGRFIETDSQILDIKIIKIPKCYPVYDNYYKPYLENIINFIKKFENLQLIGRYGSFKYNNQDHSILMGFLAANNIVFNQNNDLWSVNVDYEYHESSIITSSGLMINK